MIAIVGLVILAVGFIAYLLTTIAGPFINALGDVGSFITQISSTTWLLYPIGAFLFLWGTTKRPIISMVITIIIFVILKFGLLGFTI